MADVGTGTSISFGTSTWAAEITNLKFSGISRPSVKTSHLGTTTYDTFMPGDLVDYGNCNVEFQVSPTTTLTTKYVPPITAAPETITISFPLYSGNTAKATFACSGFVTDFDMDEAHEELQSGTMVIKWTGTPTWSNGS